jgi:hypothetical protein
VLALIAASPVLAQTGPSATPSNDSYSSGSSTGSMPAGPLGYLAIGGSAALFGGLWLTRRHRARGQMSW